MARTVTLRPWQKAALERLTTSTSPDFLAVATPGAGKTTFALTAARHALAERGDRRLVVVVPTAHLKLQWARAAAAFDLHLDPMWAAADGSLPGDMHGVVTTYQQVSSCAEVLRGLATDAFVIFDELHHAADDRAWGDAVRTAFEPAARRLALSGTPFRSDTHSIPFVRYRLDEAEADFEYGYGDALADGGVVRPVYFPRIDGRMEWSAPDGSVHAHSFDDPLDAAKASQRLRTAYSLEGEWLPHVLRQAHEQLLAIRAGGQPDAGGLVIATDQDHAKGIARLLRDRFQVRAVVATSDDPGASTIISRFAASADPWIVAVRMVSEGVDIPRLRVGVFATTTTTELFFRQAVGRLVRWTRGVRGQKSFLYIPDEARLRARAFAIAEQRRHSLRHDDRVLGVLVDPTTFDEAPADDLFSQFAPISAVPLGDGSEPDWVLDDDGFFEPAAGLVDELTIPLPPLPTGGVRGASASDPPDGRTLRERKEALREANATRTRMIARHTGQTHAAVNAELNRVSGVRKVSEATAEQLQKRLDKADAWLRQAAARRVAG
ncbi:MAG TPA: DEAD/DEAH box helicase [Acidimicrobiales bacterium]|nr:DEAD/DEAH box helicase [Acidimicrobiales bacterium]